MKASIKTDNNNQAECKTTILGVAGDNSYWDAETEVKEEEKIRKTRIRVFDLSKLLGK